MYSLFSTKSSETGFRLEYFEVYNWGTFDKEVYTIYPKCNTTLITGVNGSGKTTFIQGLLTLLVPEKRLRFYDHQRTEESYVLGEYGDIATEMGRQIQRLRDDKSNAYSLLLATFKNEEKYVTLIQARWFAGGEMKRKYIIAFRALKIVNDINSFDPKGDWIRVLNKKYPKQGTKDIILSFDGPTKYAEGLMKVFGMRSSKALTLFDQTMRLKVMGNLDEFVRQNMLEESAIENDFQSLRSNYQKLLDAHREMQKAEKQLELLWPVKTHAEELNKSESELTRLLELRDTNPVYFSHRKLSFLTVETDRESSEFDRIKEEEISLRKDIEINREAEKVLEANIRADETGKQIQGLESEINRKVAEKTRRDEKLSKYNIASTKINFEENPTESQFYEFIKKALDRNSEIEYELKDKENGIQKKLRLLENEKEVAEKQQKERQKELNELTKQKNNITGRVSEIRQEILAAVGATESEIPFIGELIQVLPSEKHWEMAIEKVLHNFALRLIVPEKYYRQVNSYVNDNNLKGRITYDRLQAGRQVNNMFEKEQHSIISKLEIKRSSLYSDWVESQIILNHNYICTDKENLPVYNKGITINGLIKSGTRHEKDDRPQALGKENFVLGWDNKEKIKVIRNALSEAILQVNNKNEEIKKFENREKRLENERKDISDFSKFENYSEIDCLTINEEISVLEKRKEELEKSNNRIRLLKEQLGELQSTLRQQEIKKDALIVQKTTKDSILQSLAAQREECLKIIEPFKDLDFSDKFNSLENAFEKDLKDLAYTNLPSKQVELREKVGNMIETERQQKQKIEMKLQSSMKSFKRPDDEIMQAFKDWTSDTHKLGEDLRYVDDYLEISTRIEKEELIEYRTQFKKYLNEDMINKMADFKTILDTQEEQIFDSLDALNESLKKIDFKKNPKTFIQLIAIKNSTQELDNFRGSLIDWKPDIAEYEKTKDDQILERSFLKIKALIDKLTEKEDWRKYVTDVRNWLKFLAKEYYREDLKKPAKIYDNTGKLSSGEQAQITYTIMGAAIAYQYGILKDGLNTNSFRFICVDEAFAKQDEEKADYLMDLVKKLNLQMLLVTPDDKIQIAEPYISGVHIVHRVNNRNSRIFDTTIEQAKNIVKEQTLETSDYSS